MTYGVTNDGFVIKPLATIKQEIYDSELANVDAGLTSDEQSVIQNVNTANADLMTELWELGQAIYNANYRDSASGFSLDQVNAITGTTRSQYSKTTVVGQVTLNPFKSLPLGSIAHLTDQPSKRFVTLAAVPAADGGGTFDVTFEAEDTGAISVAAGQLSTIAEPQSGWTAVTNALVGATGDEPEPDPAFRLKGEDELEAAGATNVDAIKANILQSGAEAAQVFENVTGVVSPTGIPPHTIHCIVRGGVSADIAQAIFESKAGGIDSKGLQINNITDSSGTVQIIRHDLATELVLYVIMVLDTDPVQWGGAAAIAAIKQRIDDYVNGLDIGDDVIYDRIKCSALSETGVIKVTSLFIDFAPAPTGVIDLVVADSSFASADQANMDITAP